MPGDDHEHDREPEAPGWDAIDEALWPIYGDAEPLHWGTVVPYALGGPDPIHGISAYRRDNPRHHLHYVTYGFSELYEKESDDPKVSGYGFELTFRLACEPEDDPPNWVLNFLQNIARYVFQTGNVFGAGHTMSLNGPIQKGSDTAIRSIAFTQDPELPPIATPNGRVEFLQVVGLTEDERVAARQWNAEGFLEFVRTRLLLTDLSRASYLTDETFRQEVERRTIAEGSSTDSIMTDRLAVQCDADACRLVVTALAAPDMGRWLSARLPHGRDFHVETDELVVRFEPGDTLGWWSEDDEFVLSLTVDQSRVLDQLLTLGVGVHTDPALPGLTVEIERTEITDEDGRVVDVIE